MRIKTRFILTASSLVILTACGPNEGFCKCEIPEANNYYKWGPLALSQKKRVEKMCQNRASAYNTTCTLTVEGSK